MPIGGFPEVERPDAVLTQLAGGAADFKLVEDLLGLIRECSRKELVDYIQSWLSAERERLDGLSGLGAV